MMTNEWWRKSAVNQDLTSSCLVKRNIGETADTFYLWKCLCHYDDGHDVIHAPNKVKSPIPKIPPNHRSNNPLHTHTHTHNWEPVSLYVSRSGPTVCLNPKYKDWSAWYAELHIHVLFNCLYRLQAPVLFLVYTLLIYNAQYFTLVLQLFQIQYTFVVQGSYVLNEKNGLMFIVKKNSDVNAAAGSIHVLYFDTILRKG